MSNGRDQAIDLIASGDDSQAIVYAILDVADAIREHSEALRAEREKTIADIISGSFVSNVPGIVPDDDEDIRP